MGSSWSQITVSTVRTKPASGAASGCVLSAISNSHPKAAAMYMTVSSAPRNTMYPTASVSL